MAEYDLAPEALQDLEGIFDYTIEYWGIEQAHRYKKKLTSHFEGIGRFKVKAREFLKSMPELYVSRCEHHYVFHLKREHQVPLIVAVLHEQMDLLTRIRGRLEK